MDEGRRTLAKVTGIISLVAFSFIVHEPKGIIDVASETSLACSWAI